MISILRHLLLFILLLPFFVVAQTNRNVNTGDSLTAGVEASTPWLSSSSDFAFGFHQLENEDLFLLAIWYYKIAERTIVWYANGGNPAPRGSTVKLTRGRGLVLNDPQGVVLWRSEFLWGMVAYGVMNDTGNFVLVGDNSDNLWGSFEHPTDTLLPTQIMEKYGVLLASRHKENNFSFGRFQFRLLEDGNAVLNPINLPTNYSYEAYYISNTYGGTNQSNSGVRVVFNKSGYLYVERRSGEQKYIFAPEEVVSFSATSNYHRAILNFDGVFSISYHPKNNITDNKSWTVIKNIPDNICNTTPIMWGGMGPCGYNSICLLGPDQRPSCKCPEGYSLLDSNDEYGSCKPDFIQGCEEDGNSPPEELYDWVVLENTVWPGSDYDLLDPIDVEECKTSCMHDCLCAVAIFRDTSCWKKKLPLSNGRRGEGSNAFIKIRKNNSTQQNPPPLGPDGKDQQGNLIIVVLVLLGSSVFVNFLFVGAICLGLFSYYHKKLARFHQLQESAVERNLRHFTYQELAEATNGFKEELGRGSCGIVYKGAIETVPVAVKKLDRMFEDNDKEFKAEVNVIGKTHHKNLVRLLGYCDEGQHRMLVYEFFGVGTLASFLFGDLKPSWTQRINIAFGVARGLFYLHEECSTQIIHCDIKPQNILLDDYYNARISDFGLAKLLIINQSQTKTGIRGTKGYISPDWFRTSPITVKVDVYSFGVVLLEIICCRRNVDMEFGGGEKGILTDWAYDCFQEGRLDALVENDVEVVNDMKQLERFVMVAIWCLQEDPSLRPTMKKVLLMLEGIVHVPVPPSPYPFSII